MTNPSVNKQTITSNDVGWPDVEVPAGISAANTSVTSTSTTSTSTTSTSASLAFSSDTHCVDKGKGKATEISSESSSSNPYMLASFTGYSVDSSESSMFLSSDDSCEPLRILCYYDIFDESGCLRNVPEGYVRDDSVLGPCLIFNGVRDGFWHGSCLVIVPASMPTQPTFTILNDQEHEVTMQFIGAYRLSNFYRFGIKIRVDKVNPITIQYTINDSYPIYNFRVQSTASMFRWTFWSCNGWSLSVTKNQKQKLGGTNRLWKELMRQHEENPFHCMVGGGDQLYTDLFWSMDIWKPWLKSKSRKEYQNAPFTPEMEQTLDEFFFTHYVNCFFFQTKLGEAMAYIPSAFIVDDHDIFDGWGSYPNHLHNSNVFQGIKRIAFKYWLLFQAHSNEKLAPEHGYFGKEGYSWIKEFGPRVLALGLDTRYERTLSNIVSEETYNMAFGKLSELLRGAKGQYHHLIVFLGGPIVYPRLTFIERTLRAVQALKVHKSCLCSKAGPFKTFNNQFREPELLDDLEDHWTARPHLEERRRFVQRLQELAEWFGVRVTFVSGDVHCCGFGRFDDAHRSRQQNAEGNHRLMYQVISSAIVNVPPPKGVIKLTHLGSLKSYRLDNNTKEYLDKTFDRDVDGRKLGLFSKKLLRRRNFATFVENNNFLHVELHAEAKKVAVYTTTSYELQIPTLNIRQPGLEEHSDELSPSSSLSSSLFQISTAGHNVDVDSSLESPSSEDSGGITILRRSKAEGDEETGEILADDATLKAIDESRPANKLDSTHN